MDKKEWKDYKPEKILNTPRHGWSHFVFDEDMRVSYIDDVPGCLLETIKQTIINNNGFLISFDCEGYDFSILSYDNYDVEIIIRKDDTRIIRLDKNFKSFCYDVVFSIESDIDDWVMFYFDNESEENQKAEKERLLKLIQEIKEILPNSFWY